VKPDSNDERLVLPHTSSEDDDDRRIPRTNVGSWRPEMYDRDRYRGNPGLFGSLVAFLFVGVPAILGITGFVLGPPLLLLLTDATLAEYWPAVLLSAFLGVALAFMLAGWLYGYPFLRPKPIEREPLEAEGEKEEWMAVRAKEAERRVDKGEDLQRGSACCTRENLEFIAWRGNASSHYAVALRCKVCRQFQIDVGRAPTAGFLHVNNAMVLHMARLRAEAIIAIEEVTGVSRFHGLDVNT
jgi:hypothetical protein